jgi:hypothetical protein
MVKSTLKFTFVVAAFALTPVAARAESQARIVRLSDVQGSVQIDKNSGLGYEKAFLNLPIIQGTQLRTRQSGRAEVELEDGSTLRLTPNTTVEFSQLGRSDSGQRLTVVNLVEGEAYVNFLGKAATDDITLNFAREKVELAHPAHFRIQATKQGAEFAVLKGDVDVQGPSGAVKVTKKKMVSFVSGDEEKTLVAANFRPDDFDAWDKQASQYADVRGSAKAAGSPFGYGASDLSYYGSYSNVSGYGNMWQPFFTNAGWNPFMDGAWGFYPGYGYMWASAYPWGWLPYRYGNWIDVPGAGWMWQPGGWNQWNAVPRFTGTSLVTLRPPSAGTLQTVAVGRAGSTTLGAGVKSGFVVNVGSAGLGIPRGAIVNLHQLNRQVARAGSATVRPTAELSGQSPSDSANPAAVRATGHSASGGSQHLSTGVPLLHR